MSSEKYQNAKDLIDQGRYNEARALLRTINHPMALDLLDEIDRREGKPLPPVASSNPYAGNLAIAQPVPAPVRANGFWSCSTIIVSAIVVGILGLCGLAALGAALPTKTPPPPPPPTLKPTITLTPSITPTLSEIDIAQTKVANVTATQQTIIDNKTATVVAAQATGTFVAGFKEIDTRELMSYVDKHVGEKVIVKGKVFHIIDDQDIQIYIDGTPENSVYIKTDEPISGIYEKDWVTVYGIVKGTGTSTNLFGAKISFPVIDSAVMEKQ